MQTKFSNKFHCDVERYLTKQEWLASRVTFLGASEAAGILGMGYSGQSQLSVWSAKVHGHRVQFSEEALQRMRLGQIMEPAIADAFEEISGFETVDPGEYTVFRDIENDWLATTLDRIAIVDGEWMPVEIKLADGRFRAEWVTDAPIKFQIQLQHQLLVTGAQEGFLVGFVGGTELFIHRYARNEKFLASYIDIASRFWAQVEAAEQPELHHSIESARADAEALKIIYPVDDGETIDLGDEFHELDEDLQALKRTKKTIETEITEKENRIKEKLGESSIGLLPNGGKYTWKLQTTVVPAKEQHVRKYRVLRRGK